MYIEELVSPCVECEEWSDLGPVPQWAPKTWKPAISTAITKQGWVMGMGTEFSSDFRSGSQFDYDLADARSLKSLKHPDPITSEHQVIKRKSWKDNHSNPFVLQMNKLRLVGRRWSRGSVWADPMLGSPSVHLLVPGPWAVSFCGPGPLSPNVSNDRALPLSLVSRTRNRSSEVWAEAGPGLEENRTWVVQSNLPRTNSLGGSSRTSACVGIFASTTSLASQSKRFRWPGDRESGKVCL